MNQHVTMYSRWCEKHELGREISVHKGIVSEVNKVEFVSDMSSYIMLRGCQCDIVLSVHVSTEDKTDGIKGSFNEELERVLAQFSQQAEKTFSNPSIGNDSLHVINNDNGIRVANSATSKNLIVKSMMFPHYDIQNLLGRLLMDRRAIKLNIFRYEKAFNCT